MGVLVSIIMLSPGVESQLYKVSVREGFGRRPGRPALYRQGKVVEVPGTDDVQMAGKGDNLNLLQSGSQRRILFIATALCRQVSGVRLSSRVEAQGGTLCLGQCIGVDPFLRSP